MPAHAHPKATTPHPHPTPTTPTPAAPYEGPRATAAEFFTFARDGRAQTAPPPFRDGDSASCPRGNEWMRHHGRWIIPGHLQGLNLADRTVTRWWQTRHTPGSLFALVHRLNPEETGLIEAPPVGGRY
ncbi:hypothetical protein AB0N09_06015 [Streptomyces erythrochromogenes]|uniref:hypothetical protein n=1 Tax=Streptomyces erythrochromogenes TaxID=285574 RepID=UPI0034162BE8